MKKQILKTAVIAAIVLPMAAQAGVYGRNDGLVKYWDDDATDTDYWDVDVDKMRWGIVGSEDLGNGMKALYHYEWAMNNNGITGSTQENEKTRLAYVGLQGGFGKLTIGRNWSVAYGPVWSKTDFADAHGDGKSNLSGNRLGDMVTYHSPDFSGFTGSVGIVMSNGDNGTQEDDIDLWEVAGNYTNGPLQIGATFRNDQRGDAATAAGSDTTVTTDVTLGGTTFTGVTVTVPGASASPASSNDTDIWGIGGSYKFGDLKVEGAYGNSELDNGNETDVYAIGATYSMGQNQIYGAYRNLDADDTDLEIDDYHIGFRHFMSKETRVFVEYRTVETDDGDSNDKDMIAFGMRKDWKL